MRLLIHFALLALVLCMAPSMAVPLTSSNNVDSAEGDDNWTSTGVDSNGVDSTEVYSDDNVGDDDWTGLNSGANDTNSLETESDEVFNVTGCIVEQVVEVIEVRQIVIYQLTDDGELLLLSGDDGSLPSSEDDDVSGDESGESSDFSPFFGFRSDTATTTSKHNRTAKAVPKAKKTRAKKVRVQKPSTRADSNASKPKKSTAGGNGTTTTTTADSGNCTKAAVCQSSADCGGVKAKCIGAFVGTCNCGACVGGLPCQSDAHCGGLQQACSDKGFCDCVGAAHKSKGFVSISNTLLTFCNHKKCDADADGCFGLPCHTGLCAC